MIEPVILPEQAEVDKYLPPYHHPYPFHPDTPASYGIVMSPGTYAEVKKAYDMTLRESKEVVVQAWKEFGDIFGRYYSPIESYRTEGAKTLLMSVGSLSETAKVAIDKKREQGEDVGLLILHLWRPFPFEELYQAIESADTLVMFDRCISPGGPGGPIISEVQSALYAAGKHIKVARFIGGLCGRNLSVEQFEEVIDRGKEMADKGSTEVYETVGIRG